MSRLNLGCGKHVMAGYDNRDRALGSEVYPLPDLECGTVEEVRASHVLEHFPHQEAANVIKEWARVLKPGGVLKVAVPNFDAVVDAYKDGKDWPVEGYLMGGQLDGNDYHRSIWNKQKLTDALQAAGLQDVRPWTSELADCAALPVSLNLQATKPSSLAPAPSAFSWPRIGVVMSVPRLGFMDNSKCIFEACIGLPVTLHQVCGVFWGSCMTEGIERALADGCEYVLTVDYDTLFVRDDIKALVELMRKHPEAAAIAPLQAGRDRSSPLITMKGKDGEYLSQMDAAVFAADVVPVHSAHFGLTLIRASLFDKFSKPWFAGIERNGRSADDDIHFWRKLEAEGHKLFLAPHVVVGHLELVCAWPGDQFITFHQGLVEYREKGKPERVWR